ncbi:Toll-like receptor 4 [Elysia marginata]|uniref:Toll-like receptor 4 n=1 Tax=Elysia marginata TaxID=1093978 RepID=A0AAV4EGD5_9GAST|nr:Toll-like receptor 4 [Elysia marginata]
MRCLVLQLCFVLAALHLSIGRKGQSHPQYTDTLHFNDTSSSMITPNDVTGKRRLAPTSTYLEKQISVNKMPARIARLVSTKVKKNKENKIFESGLKSNIGAPAKGTVSNLTNANILYYPDTSLSSKLAYKDPLQQNVTQMVSTIDKFIILRRLTHRTLAKSENRRQNISHNVNSRKNPNLARQTTHKAHVYHPASEDKRFSFSRYRLSMAQKPYLKSISDHQIQVEARKDNIFQDKIPCPKRCDCSRDMNHSITFVDCSNKGLVQIPLLPSTSEIVLLQNNNINTISCHSFKSLRLVTKLDLSHNKILALANCSFSSLDSLQYLKMSDCSLKNLPHGIFNPLHKLLVLDLSINHIQNIDGQLFLYMTKLTTLSLYRNNLTNIKNCSFHGLASLQFLSLQRNSLKYIPTTFEPRAFEGLSSLQILHIQGNQYDLPHTFTYPDRALSLLPWLRQLRLDGQPRPLGLGFASLTNLSVLDFSTDHQHDLESFCVMEEGMPSNFFANLKTRQPLYLNMSSCSIYKIPAYSFAFVPTIHTLDLSGNHYLGFDSFEQGSKGLQNSTLTVLNLSHIVKSGRIAEIKNTTFKHLTRTNLKVLILDTNHLIKISPKAVLDLPKKIEFISLQDNSIQFGKFLEPLLLLYNLKTVKLTSQLHYSRKKNSSLESSALHTSNIRTRIHTNYKEDNYAAKMDWTTPFIQNIRSDTEGSKPFHSNFLSTVKGKGINDFCGGLSLFPSLENLSSSSTPLPQRLEFVFASDINTKYSIPAIHVVNNKVLKYLDYSKNGAKCFGGPLTGVPSLQFLDLSYNWCLKVNPLMFSDMPSLSTLRLHHNVLGRSLHDDVDGITFSALVKLSDLDLSVNSIKQLSPKAFTQNPHLRNLNLSNNDLSHFHPNLSGVKSLETLDLSVNNLEDLSEATCHQLLEIKRRSANFTVRLKDNRFLCDCGNLPLLRLILDHPNIFYDLEFFQCQSANGSRLGYHMLAEFVPHLEQSCVAETTFIVVFTSFITLLSVVLIFSIYYYKRWQWKYLYYLGKSRLHIGSTLITYSPVARAFITYDQEHRDCRNWIRELVLPALQRFDVSYVLGEVDFAGGPVSSSIAGAVASTDKTLVFLSRHIFKDFHREFEINLAIMHELHMRRRILVPVLLLNCEDVLVDPSADNPRPNQQERSRPPIEQVNAEREIQETPSPNQEANQQAPDINMPRQARRRFVNNETPANLINCFPPEIAAYLRGQAHRCLIYDGDSEQFWSSLREALLDEC